MAEYVVEPGWTSPDQGKIDMLRQRIKELEKEPLQWELDL